MNLELKMPVTLKHARMELIYAALKLHNWNRTYAADSLGISRRGLMIILKGMKAAGYKIPRGQSGGRRNISASPRR